MFMMGKIGNFFDIAKGKGGILKDAAEAYEAQQYKNVIIALKAASFESGEEKNMAKFMIALSALALQKYRYALSALDGITALAHFSQALYAELKGLVLFGLEDSDTAITCLNEAIFLEPDNFSPYHNLGIIYSKQERYEWALLVLEKSLSLSPDNPAVMNTLAGCYEAFGNYDFALSLYDEALSKLPVDCDLTRCIGTNKALVLAQKGHDIYKQAKAYKEDGKVVLARETFVLAEQTYFAAFALNSNLGVVLNQLGMCAFRLEKYIKAWAYFTMEAALFEPEDAKDGYINLAETFVMMGKFALATKAAKSAVEIDPAASDDFEEYKTAFAFKVLSLWQEHKSASAVPEGAHA